MRSMCFFAFTLFRWYTMQENNDVFLTKKRFVHAPICVILPVGIHLFSRISNQSIYKLLYRFVRFALNA